MEFVSDTKGFVEYSVTKDHEQLSGDRDPEVLPGDNRAYMDTNTAQKLEDEDIQRMREEGASGTDIIKSLIANSETFNAKTSFAQEKW